MARPSCSLIRLPFTISVDQFDFERTSDRSFLRNIITSIVGVGLGKGDPFDIRLKRAAVIAP